MCIIHLEVLTLDRFLFSEFLVNPKIMSVDNIIVTRDINISDLIEFKRERADLPDKHYAVYIGCIKECYPKAEIPKNVHDVTRYNCLIIERISEHLVQIRKSG